MATKTEIKNSIIAEIKEAINPSSITPNIVGNILINMVDSYEDAITVYKEPEFEEFSMEGQAKQVEVGTSLSGIKTFNWTLQLNDGEVNTVTIYDTVSATSLVSAANTGSIAKEISAIQLNDSGSSQSWKAIANNSNGSNIDSPNFTVTSYFGRYSGSVAFPISDVIDVDNGSATRTYASTNLESGLKSEGENVFTLETGIEKTNFVVLLQRATTIKSVIDETNAGVDITSEYKLTSCVLKDAGGTDRIYNLYTLTIGSPYSKSAIHTITTT